MPKPTLFGVRLKQARELRGMSQSELAAKAQLTPIHISHFETGVKPSASAATLVKLADALSVSLDYLLGRTDQVQAVGEKVNIVLRSLGEARAETIENVAAVAHALTEQDRLRRKQEE